MNHSGVTELRRQFIEILTREPEADRSHGLAEFTSKLIDQVEGIEREWQERIEDLDFLFQASQDISSLQRPEDLSQRLVGMICKRLAVERCSVMLLDETGEYLEAKAASGIKEDWSKFRVPIGEGISGRVAKTGEPLLIKDIERHEEFRRKSRDEFRTKSLLCVPLKAGGDVLGVINVNNKLNGTPFSELDRRLLMTICGSAATALRNADLLNKTEEARLFVTNILESLDIAVLVLDASRSVRLANSTFGRLFDRSTKDLVGHKTSEMGCRELDATVERLCLEASETGDVSEAEQDHEVGDGKTIPLEIRCMHLRDSLSTIIGYIIAIRDISESKELVNLRRLDEMKTNFVSTVSHELRTPLTSMIASVSLMREGLAGEVTPKQKRLLDLIYRNSDRLHELINDILDLSRLESGTHRLQYAETTFRELAEDSVSMLTGAADGRGVKLVVESARDYPMCVDPGKIKQVLVNLIGNAVKFTPPEGRVRILAESRDAGLRLCVEDSGIGIPQDHLDRVFDRFHQVEDAMTRTNRGSGLGLTICQKIVENHGGRIWVESEFGKGSRFIFEIPDKPSEQVVEENT